MKLKNIRFNPGRCLGWILLPFLLGAAALSAQSPSDWIPLDFSNLHSHLDSLSKEEKTEQLRDWALLAAWMDSSPGDKNPGDTLFPLQPLRLDPLRPLTQKRVGAFRWLALTDDRVLVIAPSGTKDLLQALGRIGDEYRVESSSGPKEILVYTYRANEPLTELSIQRLPAVPGQSLFSAAAGYVEEDIRSTADLEKFLARNLDLVAFRNVGDHIRLSGRAHSAELPRLVTIQDLAVLEKAAVGLPAMVRAELQRRGLRETYESRVNQMVSKVLQEKGSLLKDWADFETLRQAAYTQFPYDEFLQRSVESVLKENPPSLGFSLDPRTNYPAIAADLRAAAEGTDGFFSKWLLPIEVAEVQREQIVTGGIFDDLFRRVEEDSHAESAAQKVADRETSIASLLGLPINDKVPPAQSRAEAESALKQLLSSRSAPEEIEEEARAIVDAVRGASRAKSVELIRIADALSKKDITPLLDFRRYLETDIAGITIRPGAPKYRILDLQEMLKNSGADLKVDGIYGPATTALIKSFQKDEDLDETGIVDVNTWKALLRSDPEKEAELDSLHELLMVLEQHRDYQCARYDGQFAGTEVGMTLFYTDLVMKLWGFANKDQKPMVPGFMPETQFEISTIYKDDILHHPSTRGWLGGRPEAVGFHQTGAEMHFSPVATRLYNASSSFLFPGAEVPANFMAERFSSWWNNHYSDVADFEPQYHRLNQLMKWSAILRAFPQGQGLPAPLPELSSLATSSVGPFDAWWTRHKELKVSWDVRFLSLPAETTECMALVTSEPFRTMGGLYSLSGGVTTFTEQEIAARKAAESGRVDVADSRLRIGGIDYGKSEVKGAEKKLVGPDNSVRVRSADGTWTMTPAQNVRFDGGGSSIRNGAISTTFQPGPDGITVKSQTSAQPLASLTIDRTQAGFSLTGSQGPQIAAAVHLSSPPTGLVRGKLRTEWSRIDLGDNRFLMRSSASSDWTLISPVKDPASSPQGIRVAVGNKPMDVKTISSAEVETGAGGRRWLAVSESDLEPGDVRTALIDGPPIDAKSVDLVVNGVILSAKVDDDAIYIQRSAGSFDESLQNLRVIARSFNSDDFNAVAEAAGRPDAVQFARRSASGDVVLAGFGGGGAGIPPSGTTSFDDLIPPDGKYLKGILVRRDRDAPLRVTEGLIEMPLDASEEFRNRARRLSQTVESKPKIGERIEKLASIVPADLDFFEKHREERSANYIEFKAVPADKLGSTVLVDLQFTPEDPIILFRQGEQISTMDVPQAREASEARKFVDDTVRGLSGGPTVAELKSRSRPYFDIIENVHQKLGSTQFLTKETGEVNAETVYRIGGGDSAVRFDRDVADVAESVAHRASKVTLDVAQSVVASTVALNDPQFPAANALAADLDSLLVRVVAPVSYIQFMQLLEEPNLKQITLVVRYRDAGLVFSDRWASLEEIADDLGDVFAQIPEKDLLHLITNGGQEVVDAFADSDRFKRVLLTRFTSGSQPGFEDALRKISTVFHSYALSAVAWTVEDWNGAKQEFPEISSLLDSQSKTSGTDVETNVNTLVKRGRESGIDWASDSGQSFLDLLREKLKRKPNSDADSIIDSISAEMLSSIPNPESRSATATLQGVVQRKN